MRRFFLILNAVAATMLLLAFFVSCSPRTPKVPEPSAASVHAVLNFRTDSLNTTSDACEVSIVVEYPDNAPAALSYAIGEYICESLGGTWTGVCTDYPAILSYYVKSLTSEYEAYNAEVGGAGRGCFDRVVIRKYAETDKYLSYMISRDLYLGGAHGSQLLGGITLRKSDGRRMGWELFTGQYNEDFTRLIKDGLMAYWNLSSEAQLKENFMNVNDYYSVPLPSCPPIFSQEGVTFIYNEYEIAAYALGRPQFTVAYEDLEPFMMVTAKKLL